MCAPNEVGREPLPRLFLSNEEDQTKERFPHLSEMIMVLEFFQGVTQRGPKMPTDCRIVVYIWQSSLSWREKAFSFCRRVSQVICWDVGVGRCLTNLFALLSDKKISGICASEEPRDERNITPPGLQSCQPSPSD